MTTPTKRPKKLAITKIAGEPITFVPRFKWTTVYRDAADIGISTKMLSEIRAFNREVLGKDSTVADLDAGGRWSQMRVGADGTIYRRVESTPFRIGLVQSNKTAASARTRLESIAKALDKLPDDARLDVDPWTGSAVASWFEPDEDLALEHAKLLERRSELMRKIRADRAEVAKADAERAERQRKARDKAEADRRASTAKKQAEADVLAALAKALTSGGAVTIKASKAGKITVSED